MTISPDLLCYVILLLQCLITLTLLVRTPKDSCLRYIFFPSMVYMAYLESALISLSDQNTFVKVSTSGMPFTQLLQQANLLLVTGVDLTTQPGTTRDRLASAFTLFQTLRGIGTKWQVKNTPSFPAAAFHHAKPPQRGQFLRGQMAIALWQGALLTFLFCIFITHNAWGSDGFYLYDPGREFRYNFSVEQWLARIRVPFVFGFPTSMLFLDFQYRMGSVLCVGLGGADVASWPPLFGSLGDAYTVRGFWGKFWHQYLRWPFTSVSTAITCRVLRLPKPSLIERYLNLTIVFLLSGTMHVCANIVSGVEGGNPGTLLFFLAQAGAIIFEDTVQHFWQRRRGIAGTGTPIWQRIVGFLWVFGWLGTSFAWWWYPIMRALMESDWYGMLRAIQVLGLSMPGIVAVVVGGGIFLRMVFGAEL
ncbi:hypothetical protein BO71DRAFT_364127 [Aspergillus ellipticus CBS 707.79]|uniref:Wax synthase domain-containing protein n=1 Tax=Aspergillus ellipticus CBS 707.79 TaxID=1448320 RepID=A0A319EDH0_9EURO|nr:hypothetical protein BO71DRAFT_364127 [Aspergillus ellipticus CBS 707.79]